MDHPFPRLRQPEWMDENAVDPRQLRQALRFIQRINAALGYTRGIIAHLQRFSSSWTPGQRIDIIDLATGSADIPRAILQWAGRQGHDIRITAVDRHPVTAHVAREAPCDRLSIVQADVFNLPFAPGSFDYAICAMFLHHLDEPRIVHVLRTMDSLSRRGVIAADLLRSRRACAWITLFTLFSSTIVRHDARASVRQALTRDEILALRDQAGIGYASYHPQFGHRFALAGHKPFSG